ncbi:hypothetical protein IAT38_007685 [Cryptococcus sp. DSM 104549]
MEGKKVLSEEDVEATLTKLRAADADRKVDVIQFFSLELEGVEELPESTIDPFILLLPPLLRSPHSLLQSSVLTSFLPFFLPLIPHAPTAHLRLALLQVLPALIEKLNDPKDRVHSAAANAVFKLGELCYAAEPPVSGSSSGSLSSSAGKAAGLGQSVSKGKEKETLPAIWERCIKDALQGKAWRPKVEGMKVLVRMRSKVGGKLGLKGWLGVLVDLLEDGDGNVRDQAKETVIALLSPPSTPPAARSELKKLLLARNVRKTIADNIIARVIGGESSGRSTPAVGAETPKDDPIRSGAATPALSAASDDVEIVYIASGHDLTNELTAMLPFFEGKETEQNWAPREKSIVRIRGMIKGQAHVKYHDAFVAGLKNGMMEGAAKTVMSLRTTVATQSCLLLKELPECLGGAFDNFVEYLLPILGKMAGFTKKLIAERSQAAVTAIIVHTHVHPRTFITHISAGIHDKNIQTRSFSTNHLKTFLDIHAQHVKHQVDSTAGLLDMLDAAIRKALADVNPGVRDMARQAYWTFNITWPQRAAVIMASLDGQAKKQLDKANPRETNVEALAAPKPKPAKSGIAAMMAERRRAAKAAEAAAGRRPQDSPRIVSNPVPSSPSVPQGLPRSSSSTSITGSTARPKPGPLSRSITSPEGSPRAGSASPTGSPTPPPQQRAKPASRDLLSPPRSRSSSLGKSPPKGSPSRESPLRQSSTFPKAGGVKTPTPAGETPQKTQGRKPLPSFSGERGLTGLGMKVPEGSVEEGDENEEFGTPTRGSVGTHQKSDDAPAHLDLPQPSPSATPFTPARQSLHANGNGNAFTTPLNAVKRRRAWEDSPRPEAVTPLMMEKLKERKHERSWWVKRQELMDKASPLKPTTPSPSSAIIPDLEALASGQPDIRNLQKLALFSSSHPVLPTIEGEEDESADAARRTWAEDGLFERLMDELLAFLRPEKEKELLEQGLVVLWEIVQHQWPLVEDVQKLCQALFKLRASHDATVLESTNALVSLLSQIADPMLLLLNLRSSLDRWLGDHPAPAASNDVASVLAGLSLGAVKETPEQRIRNSGYLFGLTSIGMCVLRLSAPVVGSEGPKLGHIVTAAMSDSSSTVRQASQSLLLAIQCILHDSSRTLAFVPDVSQGQKDLAIYYMAQNGILEESVLHKRDRADSPGQGQEGSDVDDMDGDEEEATEKKREKMNGELAGLMARGVARE